MTILCFSNRDTELGWLRYGCIMRYPWIEHLGTTIMIRNCQFYHGTGIAGPVRTFTGNGLSMEWYSKVTINKGRENGNLRKSIISLWHFSVSPATQICTYIYILYLSHIWWSIQETTALSIPQASSNHEGPLFRNWVTGKTKYYRQTPNVWWEETVVSRRFSLEPNHWLFPFYPQLIGV